MADDTLTLTAITFYLASTVFCLLFAQHTTRMAGVVSWLRIVKAVQRIVVIMGSVVFFHAAVSTANGAYEPSWREFGIEGMLMGILGLSWARHMISPAKPEDDRVFSFVRSIRKILQH